MNLEIKRALPSAEEIKKMYPLHEGLDKVKKANDQAISDIICGRSNKLLLIIGPCSADREDAVLDYVNRLRELQEKVKREQKVVEMAIYMYLSQFKKLTPNGS